MFAAARTVFTSGGVKKPESIAELYLLQITGHNKYIFIIVFRSGY